MEISLDNLVILKENRKQEVSVYDSLYVSFINIYLCLCFDYIEHEFEN